MASVYERANPSQQSEKRRRPALAIDDRRAALRRLCSITEGLQWSHGLMMLLLDELNDTEQLADLEELIGKVQALSPRQYSQAAALAIALRYSWRRDQFGWISRRIRTLARRTRTIADRD